MTHISLPNKEILKLPNSPIFEEAFKNMERDFATDLYFYQGDCLTSRFPDVPKVEGSNSEDLKDQSKIVKKRKLEE